MHSAPATSDIRIIDFINMDESNPIDYIEDIPSLR